MILMKYFVFLLFIFLLIYFIFSVFKKKNREDFINKIKLDKKLIVVMMDGTINENYKNNIKSLCENYIQNCSYNFNKDKVDDSKMVNITYDKSLNTSTNIKNSNYLIIYEKKKKNNSYNKKFKDKWCTKKKKNKNNYIVVDFNNIYSESNELLDQIETKFKINIPMKGLLKYGSFNNINIDDIKNIASSVSMDDLKKQFMNKI